MTKLTTADNDRHQPLQYAAEDGPMTITERLEKERDEARQIVRDIHWMAVRYADGRKSYAPGMLNDALRKAYDGGWLVYNRSPEMRGTDPQYARDGDKPEYRSIEERAEVAEAEVTRLREALKPFALEADDIRDKTDDQQVLKCYAKASDFRRARTALQDAKGGTL